MRLSKRSATLASAIVTMAEVSVAERLLSLMSPPATAVVPCVLPRGAGDLAGV